MYTLRGPEIENISIGPLRRSKAGNVEVDFIVDDEDTIPDSASGTVSQLPDGVLNASGSNGNYAINTGPAIEVSFGDDPETVKIGGVKIDVDDPNSMRPFVSQAIELHNRAKFAQ